MYLECHDYEMYTWLKSINNNWENDALLLLISANSVILHPYKLKFENQKRLKDWMYKLKRLTTTWTRITIPVQLRSYI